MTSLGVHGLVRSLLNSAVAVFFVVAAGCGVDVFPATPGSGGVDGNRDTSQNSSVGTASGEPNDAFTQAIVALFDGNGVAKLEGAVAAPGDLDVFSLGPMSPGDRIVVDTTTGGSALDISIALFDDAGRLAATNDDEGECFAFQSPGCDAFADLTVRHGGDPYYLVVTHSAFASPETYTGSYTADVDVDRSGDVPAPRPQLLFLDFDGAQVNSPVLGVFTLEPFDASEISGLYAGQTDTLKELIRDTMEQNYARFNVAVMTSDDPPSADGVTFSTIHFGGFNRRVFGISESVDEYNADCCDDALIYTSSFAPATFTLTPTVEELSIAIANVAAHEAGHLLGLNHTDDDLDLMDDQSPADAFLEDQEFTEAPLSADIMPIGTQDGVLLLSEIVGLQDGVTLKSVYAAQRSLEIVMRAARRRHMGVSQWRAFRGGKFVGLHSGTKRRLKARRIAGGR